MVCPLCGSAEGETLYRLEAGFATRRCRACRFVFMLPRPTEAYLSAYYAEAAVYSLDSEVADDYANAITDKIALIGGLLRRFSLSITGRAVDFGAGQGAAVKALSQLGFDAEGIEISARARAAGMRLFGVKMRDGRLEDLPEDTLNCLTLFDVLEHMLDPKAFVLTAKSRLKTGGSGLFVVPNFNSFDRLIRGKAAKALIFPEHVNQFTIASLKHLFADAGFTVLYAGSPPPYGVAISFGWRWTVLKALGRNAVSLGLNRLLTWLKRYIVYPLPNWFVEKTGWFGQSLLILVTKTRE